MFAARYETMIILNWVQTLFPKDKADIESPLLPVRKQIKAWRKANGKISWKITAKEFEKIEPDWFSGKALRGEAVVQRPRALDSAISGDEHDTRRI